MSLSTHVLDVTVGVPAADVVVTVDSLVEGEWRRTAERRTDADGRIHKAGELDAGTDRITFSAGAHFAGRGTPAFYPEIAVIFDITDAAAHHHVPLLLSPFGFRRIGGAKWATTG